MRLMVKWRPTSRRNGTYSSVSSHSALSSMIASVGPSPNVRKRSNTRRIAAMLASMSSSRQQLAALVLARRIADLGRAAAHQHDRPVARLLQPAQHHDLDQAADMEARRGRVEADVGGDDLPLRQRVERRGVGQLVDVAALVEQLEEGGRYAVMRRRLASCLARCYCDRDAAQPRSRTRRRRRPSAGFKLWAKVDHAAALGAQWRRPTSGSASARLLERFVIPEADRAVARRRAVADDLFRGLSPAGGRGRPIASGISRRRAIGRPMISPATAKA